MKTENTGVSRDDNDDISPEEMEAYLNEMRDAAYVEIAELDRLNGRSAALAHTIVVG